MSLCKRALSFFLLSLHVILVEITFKIRDKSCSSRLLDAKDFFEDYYAWYMRLFNCWGNCYEQCVVWLIMNELKSLLRGVTDNVEVWVRREGENFNSIPLWNSLYAWDPMGPLILNFFDPNRLKFCHTWWTFLLVSARNWPASVMLKRLGLQV